MVHAVVKLAFREASEELWEVVVQGVALQRDQTKSLDPRRVHQKPAIWERMHLGKRRGVTSLVVGFTDFRRFQSKARNELVDQGAFAHAGMT